MASTIPALNNQQITIKITQLFTSKRPPNSMTSNTPFKPELLAPAGTLKNMKYALAYGADAVYAGQPRYSLRVRNNEFGGDALHEGIQITQQQGKKFYLACNLSPHNTKVKTFMKDIEPIIEMKPDALIMSDPGLIMMVREKWPEMPVHLSVQANVVNYASATFWHRMGVERIILSRELSLNEIEEIHDQCPELELEVFVHGALCIAYSGRCLLSGYINRRDANQGSCTNACRWQYKAHPAEQNCTGDTVLSTPIAQPEPTLGDGPTTEQMLLLEEPGRPGQLMPAFEDEHGTYIMNSKDLRAVQHVDRLVAMGIHSLKIEGRTKSHFYVARTTQTYRQAIDNAAQGKPFDPELMVALDSLANRGYTDGFYQRHAHKESQNYHTGNSLREKQEFVGEVIDHDKAAGMMTVEVKNHFALGDEIELMSPSGNQLFTLKYMESDKGVSADVMPGSGYIAKIPIECDHSLKLGLMLKTL